MSHIFGPVPSRRLGYSLGVDIVPRKVCTLDCVYCQVGTTTVKTMERKEWVTPELILLELEKAVTGTEKINYITFSGSGEPTLNSALGKIIKRIKQLCSVPVAVLTNGTLLYLPEVRNDLMGADLVVPSLDAASHDVFDMINRPHGDLSVEKVIGGIRSFRKYFQGQIWLEVMLVKGINDSRKELERIEMLIRDCGADKIQINSLARPAPDSAIEAAAKEKLQFARNLFGEKAEIIGGFTNMAPGSLPDNIQESIAELVKRRPCSVSQVSRSLGIDEAVIVKCFETMLSKGMVEEILHEGDKYYKEC